MSNPDTTALRPCPFCGCVAGFGECAGGEDDPNHGARYVECGNCHVSTPLVFACTDTVDGALADIWNRRV